jgi:hypothetical protein
LNAELKSEVAALHEQLTAMSVARTNAEETLALERTMKSINEEDEKRRVRWVVQVFMFM